VSATPLFIPVEASCNRHGLHDPSLSKPRTIRRASRVHNVTSFP
jgi:hypothetical protein